MADYVSDQAQKAHRNNLRTEVKQLEELVVQHLDDFERLLGILRDIVHACEQILQITDRLRKDYGQLQQDVEQLKHKEFGSNETSQTIVV